MAFSAVITSMAIIDEFKYSEIFISSVFVRNVFITQAINKTNTGVTHLYNVQTLALAFTQYANLFFQKSI